MKISLIPAFVGPMRHATGIVCRKTRQVMETGSMPFDAIPQCAQISTMRFIEFSIAGFLFIERSSLEGDVEKNLNAFYFASSILEMMYPRKKWNRRKVASELRRFYALLDASPRAHRLSGAEMHVLKKLSSFCRKIHEITSMDYRMGSYDEHLCLESSSSCECWRN